MFLRSLAILLLILAAGSNFYVIQYERGGFQKEPYQEVRSLLNKFKEKKAILNNEKVTKKNFESNFVAKRMIDKDIVTLERELYLRQANISLTLLAAFFIALYLLISLYRLIRFGSLSKPSGSFFHSGKIIVDPTSVEHVDADDGSARIGAGFRTQKEAEQWLRTDNFLQCEACKIKLKPDVIGRVQEIILYNASSSGGPKGKGEKLGTFWVAKPKDQFKCQKCGRRIIRSAR